MYRYIFLSAYVELFKINEKQSCRLFFVSFVKQRLVYFLTLMLMDGLWTDKITPLGPYDM